MFCDRYDLIQIALKMLIYLMWFGNKCHLSFSFPIASFTVAYDISIPLIFTHAVDLLMMNGKRIIRTAVFFQCIGQRHATVAITVLIQILLHIAHQLLFLYPVLHALRLIPALALHGCANT